MLQKIFITGGAGFIGSHIIEDLFKKYEFVIYDNFHRNAIQFTPFNNNKKITLIKGDILDYKLLETSMKGCDTVIHCAAVAGIKSVGKNTNHTMKVNLIGSFNVLEAAKKNKIKRLINFSTSEVYGPFVYKGKENDSTSIGCTGIDRWCYSISKLAAEHFAYTYTNKSEFNVITVRPFNVFGPRQVGEGAIEQLSNRAIENKPLIVYNDGMQIRSWCFVKDFTRAIALILKKTKLTSEVFNIGHPQNSITVLALAEKIIELTKSKSKIIHKPYPGHEVELRIPDISKAKKLLNYNPCIHINKGLAETIKWYKNHRNMSE